MSTSSISLGELYVKRSSVDPSKHSDELFDLFSVPAYEKREPEILVGGDIGSSKVRVESGDTLLCRIVPHIRRAWVVPNGGQSRQIASGEWIILRHPEVDPSYLRQLLLSNSFHSKFMSTVAGVGGSLMRARPAHAASIRIPLPPLPEQRRIADILDRADDLRAQRRGALQHLESLGNSLFLDMFGDPARNPLGWPMDSVGALAIKYSDGPFGSNLKSSHYEASGVRVVRLQNIGVGEFVDKDRAYISLDHAEKLKKHECVPRDVLIGTLGDPNLRACLLPEFVGRAINKADCVQFRADEDRVTPEYMVALLNQPMVERMAQGLVVGQTRARISMGRLRGLELPVPPIKLQERFSERLRELGQLKNLQRTALAKLDELFASLQHRAFSGIL